MRAAKERFTITLAVAGALLRLLDAAERAARGAARLVRTHAARDEVVLEEPEVRDDLARQLALRAAGAKERQQRVKEARRREAMAFASRRRAPRPEVILIVLRAAIGPPRRPDSPVAAAPPFAGRRAAP